jgi:hypothetical protein
MTPPRGYDVALAALRDDAKVWADVAADLSAAEQTARSLTLNAVHFSYVADKLGMTKLYEQFQTKLYTLLNEGAANDNSVSDALIKAAATYEQEEREGVHRLKGVW